jgi:hypothetical protein
MIMLVMLCSGIARAVPPSESAEKASDGAAEEEVSAGAPAEAASVEVSPPLPAAAIWRNRAEFRVPAEPQETWAWNLGAPGGIEFAWLVELALPAGPVRLGVQVWHEQGGVPSKGRLQDLVASGQAGAWPADDTDGPPLEHWVVEAVVEGADVVLRITDEAVMAWLHQARPGAARLITIRGHGPRPDQRFRRERGQLVPVIYQD